MNLIERYNEMVRKLNALDTDQEKPLFDEVSGDETITIQNVRYMEDHYNEMNKRYKELKLGVYSE